MLTPSPLQRSQTDSLAPTVFSMPTQKWFSVTPSSLMAVAMDGPGCEALWMRWVHSIYKCVLRADSALGPWGSHFKNILHPSGHIGMNTVFSMGFMSLDSRVVSLPSCGIKSLFPGISLLPTPTSTLRWLWETLDNYQLSSSASTKYGWSVHKLLSTFWWWEIK